MMGDGKEKLCILKIFEKEVFRLVYNLLSHKKYKYIMDYFKLIIYIRYFIIRLKIYINYCPIC